VLFIALSFSRAPDIQNQSLRQTLLTVHQNALGLALVTESATFDDLACARMTALQPQFAKVVAELGAPGLPIQVEGQFWRTECSTSSAGQIREHLKSLARISGDLLRRVQLGQNSFK
jgi:hypothetical protein